MFFLISCLEDVTAEKPVNECYPNVILNGVTYSLDPCTINASMVKGGGDKPFSVKINTSTINPLYGFSVFGYGVGFPTYGIIGTSSGGAQGSTTLDFEFKESVLEKGVYKGYLPIHIFNGSEMGGEDSTHYLRLKIILKVN